MVSKIAKLCWRINSQLNVEWIWILPIQCRVQIGSIYINVRYKDNNFKANTWSNALAKRSKTNVYVWPFCHVGKHCCSTFGTTKLLLMRKRERLVAKKFWGCWNAASCCTLSKTTEIFENQCFWTLPNGQTVCLTSKFQMFDQQCLIIWPGCNPFNNSVVLQCLHGIFLDIFRDIICVLFLWTRPSFLGRTKNTDSGFMVSRRKYIVQIIPNSAVVVAPFCDQLVFISGMIE